jgi:hypothetical protein
MANDHQDNPETDSEPTEEDSERSIHRIEILANEKVSDGSQPPMMLNLSLRESADSRSLDRLVRTSISSCDLRRPKAAPAHPASPGLELPPQILPFQMF